ncbi:MAG: hypothetical protein IPK44_13035 [Candidatus Accumulibacter sp.]|uniref:hypothetical protein n=1 Tax=Accumulibacter sp. TaxID=2053492 RepID=UPI0025887DE2|nr:hypothetical protein [Accumulibacter sp.]MBK8115379.1 hypothetical protein [Accumulibacter sp.]
MKRPALSRIRPVAAIPTDSLVAHQPRCLATAGVHLVAAQCVALLLLACMLSKHHRLLGELTH